MNIALEHTVEYVGGVRKAEFGDAFIRGNNGAFSLLCRYFVSLDEGWVQDCPD